MHHGALFRLSLRTLLLNLLIQLLTALARIARDLPEARRTLILLLRIASTHAGRNGFRSDWLAAVTVTDEVVVARRVMIVSKMKTGTEKRERAYHS